MAIRHELLGGVNVAHLGRIYAEDDNDTNNAIIGYGTNANPSLPPIGSVIAWRKDFHVPGQDRWEMVDTDTYQTNGTGFVMGSSYTMDGTRDFVDKLEIEIRLTAASASATIVYALFTYKDATTWSSEELSQGDDWAIKTIEHPDKTKEIDKIELFHRRSGGNSGMYAQMRNLNIKREFTNYSGELTDDCWAECNGQTIADADSVYNGVTIPDLNGVIDTGLKGQFLRGHTSSGSVLTSAVKSHNHTMSGLSSGLNSGTLTTPMTAWSGLSGVRQVSEEGGIESRPHNYSVLWIMRIK